MSEPDVDEMLYYNNNTEPSEAEGEQDYDLNYSNIEGEEGISWTLTPPMANNQELNGMVEEETLLSDPFLGKTVEEISRLLKKNSESCPVHLTAVIAGIPPSSHLSTSSLPFFSAVMDEEQNLPLASVIPPISLSDFTTFLNSSRLRTERFLRKIKKEKFKFGKEEESAELKMTPLQTLETCYSTVPDLFFNPKFDALSNSPEVLNLIQDTLSLKQEQHYVYDTADIINIEDQINKYRDEASTNLINHLDLVENCLFTQTTTRADTIFQTVTTLNALKSMVTEESERVITLRKHIAKLKAVTTTGRDNILKLQSRRTNSSNLLKTLDYIRQVSLAKPAMDRLLRSSDYTGAFQVIEEALQILDNELNGVIALRTLSRQFREMRELIGGEMSDLFVRLASDRLDISIGSNSSADQLMEEEAKLKNALSPLVKGMLRKGNLRDALAKYRVRLTDLIRGGSKDCFISVTW